MQPIFENGTSEKGGLLDFERMSKINPFIKINKIWMENEKRVVIQSPNESLHYTACGGIYEHSKATSTFCCCYEIEAIYDRLFCCEVSQGKCTSLINPSQSCGIAACTVCGTVGGCCCYCQDEDQTVNLIGCCGTSSLVDYVCLCNESDIETLAVWK